MSNKLTDLPGFGEKTEEKLRGLHGDRPTANYGEELNVDEVESMGFGGGDFLETILSRKQLKTLRTHDAPERSPSGGKIPSGFKRTGEFLYEKGQRKRAHKMFGELSDERQTDDKNERARVTTDLEEWEDNMSGLDFPGIDTPTRKPKEKDKDLGFSIDDL